MPTAPTTLRATVFSLAGTAIQLATSALITTLVARQLGPTGAGAYAYGIWFAGMLVFVTAGLPNSLTRCISEASIRGEKAEASVAIRRSLAISGAVMIGLAGLATAGAIFSHSPLGTVLLLGAAIAIPMSLRESLLGVVAGLHRFSRFTRITAGVSMVQLAFFLAAFVLKGTAEVFLSITLAVVLLSCAFYLREVWPDLSLNASIPQRVSEMSDRITSFWFIGSFNAALSMVIWARSEVFLLGHYFGPAQVAFYSLPFSIFEALEAVSGSFSYVLLPVSAARIGLSGLEQLKPVYVRGIRYVQMGMVPTCFVAALLAQSAIRTVLGPAYLAMTPVLQILLLALPLTSLAGMMTAILYGAGREHFLLRVWSVICCLNVIAGLVIVPTYGAVGAAAVKVLVQGTATVAALLYTAKLVKARFPWRNSLITYLCAGLSVLPLAFALRSRTNIFIYPSAGAGIAIYLMLMIASRQIGRADLEVLRQAFSNQGPNAAASANDFTSSTLL